MTPWFIYRPNDSEQQKIIIIINVELCFYVVKINAKYCTFFILV